MALAIRAFLELEDEETAEKLYETAKAEGTLAPSIINVYLQHWAIRKNMEKLEENFARFELDGIEPDEQSYLLKLKAMFHVSDYTRLFETWEDIQSRKPDVLTSATYNLIALSLAHTKDTDRLQSLLTLASNKFQLRLGAVYEDQGLYELILLNYGFLGDYTKIVETFNHLLKNNIRVTNVHCVAAMMGMCAASRATLAEKFVYQYVRKELIRSRKAFSINLRMFYRILLAECIEARDAEVATRTYDSIVSNSLVYGDLLPFETNCMVRLHLDRGEEELANSYFERFLNSVPSSNRTPLPLDLVRIYVNHFVETNEPAKALRFWQKYGTLVDEKQPGLGSNPQSIIADKSRLAFEVYAIAGDTKSARALFDRLVDHDITPTTEICALVMKAYINANDTKRAISLFEETQSNGVAPTTSTYNLIVRIYASRRDIAKTLSTIEAMEADGCKPDGQTWAHVIQAHMAMKKWDLAVQTFEQHYLLPTNSSDKEISTEEVSQSDSEALENASSPNLFKASLSEFTDAMTAAAHLGDKTRVTTYWNAMKAQEGIMTIDHFFAVLVPSGAQLPLFISILQHLKKRIQKTAFHMSFDHSKQLAKIIRQFLVSQHSPLWHDLELLSTAQGRGQLSWDKKKDWATLLQKVIYEWTAQNP